MNASNLLEVMAAEALFQKANAANAANAAAKTLLPVGAPIYRQDPALLLGSYGINVLTD